VRDEGEATVYAADHSTHSRRHAGMILLTGLSLVAATLVGAGARAHAETGAVTPEKTITKCVNRATGAERIIKRHGKCRRGEKKVVQSVPAAAGAKTCSTGGTCKVGDTGPGGGIVFYAAAAAQSWGRYLEGAPADWNGGGADPTTVWCNVAEGAIAGTDSQTIGSGRANTDAMVKACSSGAAVEARRYGGGGLNDWYLPALDELDAMYQARYLGTYPAAINAYYWSSSQSGFNTNEAFIFALTTGQHPSIYKGRTGPVVRPIRAF
jgi:hypothetical protein